jgi:hypothetical protein
MGLFWLVATSTVVVMSLWLGEPPPKPLTLHPGLLLVERMAKP